jgi:hypothetical protein
MATLHSTKFTMLDKEKQLRTLEAEITDRNGYPEFTMSADWGNSGWQTYDSIMTANTEQKAIIDFRKKRHLNGMSAATPAQEKILAQYPEIKDYNERVELLSSVKITGESLNFTERKEVKAQLDLIDFYKDKIKWHEDMKKRIAVLSQKYSNQTNQWFKSIDKDICEFIITNVKTGTSTQVDAPREAIYCVWFIKHLFDSALNMLDVHISWSNSHIENIEIKLTSMFAYYTMHEGKVYKYGHWWIKKWIHDHDKFRADFLKLVDKAKYVKEDKPVINEEMATAYIDEYNIKCVALAVMLWLDEDELADLDVDGNRVTHYWTEYLVGTDDEMAQEHLEDIKSFMDDCWFDWFNQKFVDTSAELDEDNDIVVSKSVTIKSSERANSLNRRDGSEQTCEINGETYYAYRQ